MTDQDKTKNGPDTPRMSPLAIVGVSCLFPKADGLGAFWANLKNGVDAIIELPDGRWSAADYFDADPKKPDMTYSKRGGFLQEYDFNPLEFGISPNDIEATDTSQLLSLVTAKRALRDAGLSEKGKEALRRVSVILGVTGAQELVIPLGARLGHPLWRRALKEAGVPGDTAEDVVRRIADGYVSWRESSFPGLLGNVIAGRIANKLDLGGTNCVVDAACASSFGAVHLAGLELAAGRADVVVTGGVDTFNDIFMYMCFSKTPALSPTGNAKPFSADCDGTILGEGLGLIVLKRLEDAERDKDRIYAVIKGVGSSSDGQGPAIYEPSSEGQARALRSAYELAGITPDTVELVEAHGTGTKVGDPTEVKALTDVYRSTGREGTWCAIGSVKSMIGHTKAAAGIAGLIKAALALKHKVLPPTIKVSRPSDAVAPGKTPFYVNTVKRPWLGREEHPRRAAISSFGFGGSNFHCVLEEHGAAKTGIDWDGETQVLAFTGKNGEDLAAKIEAFPSAPGWEALRAEAAASRAAFDASAPCRLTVVVEKGGTDLAKALSGAKAMLAKPGGAKEWSTPGGVYFGSGEREGKLAAVFPGQGSQYTGMLRDVVCQFPEALEALAEADAVYSAESGSGKRLSDLIYPHPTFDKETSAATESELRATQTAQPALGAVSLGALRVLKRFGIEPDAAVGHSYGELTALCAAGRFEPRVLHSLSGLRGRLMAGGGGDKGSMLAVQAPLAKVEAAMKEGKLDLVLANRNAPNQSVLSGATKEIERAAEFLTEKGLRNKRLPVAAAFHSPLVADARKPFEAELGKVGFVPARIPVFANSTAEEYPESPAEARAVLAGQLAKPVEFVREIEALHAAGARTFLEIGPGGRLTGLVKAILGKAEFGASAFDASNGKRSGIADLARALAWLAARGFPVRLEAWDESPAKVEPKSKKPAFSIPLSGGNYVAPKKKIPPKTPAPVAKAPPGAVPAAAPPPREAAAPIRLSPAVPPPATPPSPALPRGGREQAAPPMCHPPPRGADVTSALSMSQQNLAALQNIQEQTARLHGQFLQGQETALQAIRALIERQAGLFGPASEATSPPAYAPAAAPAEPPPVPSPLPAPAPVAVPVTAPAVEAASGPSSPDVSAGVEKTLIEIVSTKTGYPSEMLNLDMGLDSDLGIDSIKRVEILSALQEKYPDAPPVKPGQVGTLKTLRQIVDYVVSSLPAGAPAHAAPAAPAAAGTAPSGAGSAEVEAALIDVVSVKTGYPSEMLNMEMTLDADLGIDSIKRVEILSALQEKFPDVPPVKPGQVGKLKTLRQIVDYVLDALPSGGAAPSAASGALVADAAPAAGAGGAEVESALIEVVSGKTGYPSEMLNLDMALDSDLGIDSIKRVEILSALQEKFPEVPPVKPGQVGKLKTLRQIADYVLAALPKSASSSHGGGSPVVGGGGPSLPPRGRAGEGDAGRSVDPSALFRGVLSVEELDGRRAAVPVPAGSEVWVTDDDRRLAEALKARLSGAGFEVKLFSCGGKSPKLPKSLGGLIVAAPKTAGDEFLKDALLLAKKAAPGLRSNGGAFFLTVSRLDGAFGLGSLSADSEPVSGGLAGLSKTARHEWPEVSSKALDLDPAWDDPDSAAKAVVDEALLVGPKEVGIGASGRKKLSLASADAVSPNGASRIREGELVVITGGARGVTAETALALAKAFKPKLLLLGRSPEPKDEPDWLAPLREEGEIKKGLLREAGGRLSPKDLEERYRAVRANREVLDTLTRIEREGAEARYRSVDVRDRVAVGKALAEAVSAFGPVRGIVHGAGVLADKLIEEKTGDQFDRVYGTKVPALRSLLEEAGIEGLKALVLFSSSTARFGRKGQVDYAMANEVLNKLAQGTSRLVPDCRVVSVNWGPWEGGMVTPSLAKVFEAEGVGLIPLEAGAEWLVRELRSSGPAEVAVAGSMLADERVEPPGPSSAPVLKPAFERRLDLAGHPFLESHVIDGKAVLPMAMMVEWLAHGAIHGNPGLRFHGFNGLSVLKGVILERGNAPRIEVLAGEASASGDLRLVPVELRGEGQGGRELVHARAEIVLADRLPAAGDPAPLPALGSFDGASGRIYDDYLFHGPAMRGIREVTGCSAEGISALAVSAPSPGEWIRKPLRSRWLAEPLALDCAFQLMIVWSFENAKAGSLPTRAGAYRQYRGTFPSDGVRIAAAVREKSGHRAVADIEFLDAGGSLVARLEDYECVIDASLEKAFKRRTLAGGGKA